MKRFPGFLTLALVGFGATAAALADDGATSAPHRGGGRGIAQIERCLSALDLSTEQNTAIQATLTSGKSTLKADAEALRASHEQMQTDLASGADKSTLGQNVLNQDAAMTRLKNDAQALRERVASQLSSDQQEKFNACASASGRWNKGRGYQGQ